MNGCPDRGDERARGGTVNPPGESMRPAPRDPHRRSIAESYVQENKVVTADPRQSSGVNPGRLFACGRGWGHRVFVRGRRAVPGRPCPCLHGGLGRALRPVSSRSWLNGADMRVDLPLEIVWSGVAVVPVRAERADIARRFVNQTMPNHLVFALEPLAAFAARATRDWAVVGPCRGVHVGVRVEQVLRLEWLRGAAGNLADVASGWANSHAVDAHPVETRRRAGWM